MRTIEEINIMRDELLYRYLEINAYPEGREWDLEEGFIEGFNSAIELMLEREKQVIEAFQFTLSSTEYLYNIREELQPGLDPTFYHTLSYEGDMELRKKCINARELLYKLKEKK